MGRPSGLDAFQRVDIVLMMLGREEPIATLARRQNVSETTLHRWREEFLAGGQAALRCDSDDWWSSSGSMRINAVQGSGLVPLHRSEFPDILLIDRDTAA